MHKDVLFLLSLLVGGLVGLLAGLCKNIQYIKVSSICKGAQYIADLYKNLDLGDLNMFYLILKLGLIELKGTVRPFG